MLSRPSRNIAAVESESDTANRKNMALMIQLRWVAVIGQIVTILIVRFGLRISLPLEAMAIVLGALIALNLISFAWLRRGAHVSNRALAVALFLDVAALTAQLYLSGGATNPFTGLYLLQITLGAVLLDTKSSWAIVAAAGASFVMLTWFNEPLLISPHTGSLLTLHIIGMLVCFALDAVLLVSFVTRITHNLRERDAHVAELKQQAAEEDHIVRMGLLASGAAHELGTPLASVSVILGDWRRMPEVRQNPEMAQELEEMQAAVQRCKTILSGILLSAGEARGEAPVVTTINGFLGDIVNEWRDSRPSGVLHYHDPRGGDLRIVSDSALKQVVTNLLDNAFEASPEWISLSAEHDDTLLTLRVSDAGPGFTPDMLANFGKPYRSTKPRLGAGLGLFLVVNVARKLGGSVRANNRPEGGAVVTLELPLSALLFGADAHAR